jgi:hypothetical protein
MEFPHRKACECHAELQVPELVESHCGAKLQQIERLGPVNIRLKHIRRQVQASMHSTRKEDDFSYPTWRMGPTTVMNAPEFLRPEIFDRLLSEPIVVLELALLLLVVPVF